MRGRDADDAPHTLEEITAGVAEHYGFNRTQAAPIFRACLAATLLEQERCYRAARQYLRCHVTPEVLAGLEMALDNTDDSEAA